jgi:2-oxoglutarate/2-oxoacid ferredoxin oxidoreductase subunit beta
VKAAIAHQGAAFIDVINPRVAFNNHAGSTKSYDYVREHNEAVNRLDFWPSREAIGADYDHGEVIEVPAGAEGGIIRLRKLAADYDRPTRSTPSSTSPAPPKRARSSLGCCTSSPEAEDLHAHLNTYPAAFNKLSEKELCPGSAMLDKINAALR